MIFLTGYYLEPKNAFFTQLIYLLMGIIGFPVFTNFTSGLAHLLGPTGGYLLSFPLTAMIVAFSKNNFVLKVFLGTLGLLVIYCFGALFLSFYLESLKKAIVVGVLPFIGIDFLKMIIGILVSEKLYNLEVKQ
ncbi:MAG: biotin transport system substrate-specific component [Thermosipho sp. (in: thermotogales)]|nr:biotin transport system substrate-specific component [Thermosipho sp. (in: thermotogales)]MDN5324700.1 biotin transport system substrate-specific component [Thermosipho sp. (in: thermotogales)]